MGFRFIHISDHHLLESEHALRKGYSPAYAFRAVMHHIAENVAQQVDFILSTGDAVDPPSEMGYRNFRSMLGCGPPSGRAPGPLRISLEGLHEMPFYLLPGNHDHRARFLKELFPQTPPAERINAVFYHRGVQFICLDWGPGSKAVVDPVTIAFLRQALKRFAPSILVMHHHPVPTGFRWLDAFLADRMDLFWEEIQGHPILGLFFGHTHQSYEREHNGIAGFGVRSTSYSFAPQDEPLACLLPPHYRVNTVSEDGIDTQLIEVPIG